jgi:hypothetical protein
MEKVLIGKYLVRRSKTDDGKDVVILTGVFQPQNFSIDEIDGDEMWVTNITVQTGGLRFTKPTRLSVSPEDFISGEGQSISEWKHKEKI